MRLTSVRLELDLLILNSKLKVPKRLDNTPAFFISNRIFFIKHLLLIIGKHITTCFDIVIYFDHKRSRVLSGQTGL